MELKDALIITLLGLGVVYVGLTLTYLMIHSFSFIPRMEQFWAGFKKRQGAGRDLTLQPAAVPVEIAPVTPVEAEILAVITAVLEIELRLRASLVEGKFTFNR